VYIDCKTPGERRSKTTQHLRHKKMLELAQTNGLPQSLNDIKNVASALGYDVDLIQLSNGNGYSTTSLRIQGYKCLIKTRSTEVSKYHRNYIVFSLNIKYLSKFDFLILRWDNDRFISAYYIIPTSDLKEVCYADSQTVVFYIPLHEPRAEGRRVHIDWPEYRDNWDLLKKPRK
jgi:hypothetical protein